MEEPGGRQFIAMFALIATIAEAMRITQLMAEHEQFSAPVENNSGARRLPDTGPFKDLFSLLAVPNVSFAVCVFIYTERPTSRKKNQRQEGKTYSI